MIKKITKLLPGLLVCVVLGLLAQAAALVIPSLGAALFAIIFGIVCGNLIFTKDCFNIGAKFSESKLLEYSIVLTGLTMNITDIAQVGLNGVAFIALQMTSTIMIAYLIGRALKFSRKFTLLMCAGNAVCGSSAIAAVSDVLNPEVKDKGISITVVNLTGTVLMVMLPIITGLLYNHDTLLTSAMIGGTLQSIGQCIGSASFVNHDVVELATIFKIIRIIFIVFVALVFSRLNSSEEGKLFGRVNCNNATESDETKDNEAVNDTNAGNAVCKDSNAKKAQRKIKAKIPWFIIGFFICAIITTLNFLPSIVGEVGHKISTQFEIYALAGIGMRVKFKHLLAEGPKALLFGGCIGVCQIVIAICLIFLLF